MCITGAKYLYHRHKSFLTSCFEILSFRYKSCNVRIQLDLKVIFGIINVFKCAYVYGYAACMLLECVMEKMWHSGVTVCSEYCSCRSLCSLCCSVGQWGRRAGREGE